MASTRIVSITDISSSGEGIAKVDGMIYFVSGAVPLQTVEARIVEEKKRYIRANFVRLIEDNATSRPYLCPHTDCGACTLRYLHYQEQCHYKQRLLQNSFSKIAKQHDVLCYPIHTMNEHTPYRNRVDFHYGYTKEGKQDIGLYSEQSHTIVPIPHCAIIPPDMLTLLAIAREQLTLSNIPVYHDKTGFWRTLVIRYSTYHNRYMIHCITTPNSHFYHAVTKLFSALTEAFPSALCVHSIRTSTTLLAYGEHYITPKEQAFLTDVLPIANRDTQIRYGANSFFQNNYTMMNKLYSFVESLCRHRGTYLDICTGVGSIALSCFTHATKIYGIDSVKESIEYAQYNAQKNKIDALFRALDMKNIHARYIQDIDTICVDPPRGGLHPHVIKALIVSKARYIIYISCNPSTMARDCALLQKKYSILHSTPFDMFPHTVHCESVTLLERK